MKHTIDFNKIDKTKYYFDEYTADRAVRFIESFCTHVKGKLAGKPYILQDWEKEFISNLFGWKRKDNKLRKYREAFLMLPRKNSKTTLSSAISLYMILGDGEKGGEGYFGASNREQARISFDIMSAMIRQNPNLSKYLEIFRNSIEYKKSNSFFKVVSSEAGGLHGANLSFALVDEYHVHKNSELYDVFKTSMGAREQPLLITITTAGNDRTSPCFELYDYGKKIIEGVIEDETFLPVIYEAEDYEDFDKLFSIDNIKKANPSYGKSIKEDYITEQVHKAKSMPSYLNTFKQLHLNIWVDNSESWIQNSDWMGNKVDYDEEDLLGMECWAGLDLANNRDLNAFVLVFPLPNGKLRTLTYTFIPKESAERKDNISAGKAFIGWSMNKNNHLYLTDKRSRDDDFIYNKIEELKGKFIIRNIAYDRWGADQLVFKIESELGLKFTPFGQGYKSMSPAIKKVESLVIEGDLTHNNNPVLKWCLSNVRLVKDDAGNVKTSKERSKEKIDAVQALIMATYQYYLDVQEELENKEEDSPYTDNGFFFV
ncbi:terminase large subunit [Arthrospiribacter ruber]|uniref:Terminase large subunit n=1 Tax=Arthrospiribacter ruber TaxID=2487934 RepID=A0A951MFL3_9BACT|nr:terminase TerL endonuclease subunit [Arthrospiribacter ruber]MBW3469090.1 terminase large subunit [Arthrospiribacter ruber]